MLPTQLSNAKDMFDLVCHFAPDNEDVRVIESHVGIMGISSITFHLDVMPTPSGEAMEAISNAIAGLMPAGFQTSVRFDL